MGTSITRPTTWTQFAAPTSSGSGYVESDYNGSRGYLYSTLGAFDVAIPAGATITNILLTLTCENDNGTGFIPLGWFSKNSDVGFSIDPTTPPNGGFGASTDGSTATVVNATPTTVVYDFLAMRTASIVSIPDFDAWAATVGAADPLTVTVTVQATFHNPGYLRYHTGASEFFVTVEWAVGAVLAAAPPSQLISPLRQYPRTDGLGASSAPRLWPPPRSVQASNRRAGGYL